MVDIENDFGCYLSAIAEKDMDLLLLEELHVSGEFVNWLCARMGIVDARLHGAWHSISDSDGETDLLVRVKAKHLTGILVENKIGAAEQDLQAERYHIRGVRAREQGKFDEFVTCICAPQCYLDGMSLQSPYMHRIPYEDIAAWFRGRADKRSEWKCRIVEQAVAQSRRGYTMAVNRVITQFHADYWSYRGANYPELSMNRPGPKGSNSNWIILKGTEFPKGVHIDHKIDRSMVELGFDGRSIADLKAVLPTLPSGAVLAQKGKTATICLNVPPISMATGVGGQLVAIDAAFAAMRTLVPYATAFESAQRERDGS